MRVLLLEDRDTIFKSLPPSKDLKKDLLKESVIAVGKPEDLVKLLDEVDDTFWYRLFLCHDGCPEEVVKSLAEVADEWRAEFKVVTRGFQKGKLTRREFLFKAFRNALKVVPVSVPTLNGPCLSPECKVCKAICPTGAIKRKEGRVTVDPDSCTSCGLCVVACPLISLSMPGLDPNGLVRALTKFIDKDDMKIKVIWKEPKNVKVEDFKENTLVLLGIEKEFSFIVDLFTKVLGWDFECCGHSWEGSKKEPVECPYTPKTSLSPASVVKIKYALPPYFDVIVNQDLCTLCNACSMACPTGALKLETEGIDLVLKFNPLACLGCEACKWACPPENKFKKLLNLKIDVIKVRPTTKAECEYEVKARKHAVSLYCPYCGTPINVSLEEFKDLVEKYVISQDWQDVYTADEFVERTKPLIETLLCEKCKEMYRNGLIMPDELAKAIISFIGCIHEQTRGKLFEHDPTEPLRPLMLNMGMFVASYCAYWNQYFKFRHQFLPPGYLNKGLRPFKDGNAKWPE